MTTVERIQNQALPLPHVMALPLNNGRNLTATGMSFDAMLALRYST